MAKCDFNKLALQFYWSHTSAWVFSCKFAASFCRVVITGHVGFRNLSVVVNHFKMTCGNVMFFTTLISFNFTQTFLSVYFSWFLCAWQFFNFTIYVFFLQNKHKTSAFFKKNLVPANKDETLNKSAFGSDESNHSLAINSVKNL